MSVAVKPYAWETTSVRRHELASPAVLAPQQGMSCMGSDCFRCSIHSWITLFWLKMILETRCSPRYIKASPDVQTTG